MPVLYLAFIIGMILVDIGGDASRLSHASTQAAEASALASNMLVVRNALQAYLRANPAASGQVALPDLGLPGWFRPRAELRTWVQDGRAYVYYTPTQPKADLASMLADTPPGLTGFARNAQLISPRLKTTTALPPIIPDNSIVLVS